MKKLVMTLMASSVLTANVALADTTVYGKINLSVNQTQVEEGGTDTQDNLELVSHASRLGFKGDTEITEALKAIAKIEYEVSADGDGLKNAVNGEREEIFTARNVYVGVEGDWGQFIGGRKDTPLKTLGKKAELFNDYYLGDIKNALEGENRVSNMVQYASPEMAGVKVYAMGVLGEESGVEVKDNPSSPEDESAQNDRNSVDGFSIVADYSLDNFTVGLGFDSDVDKRDLIRLAANYTFADSVTLGALVQSSEISDEDKYGVADETGYVASLAWKLDSWKLKVQYAAADIDEDADKDAEKISLVLGADYKLAKTTKVYGYFASDEQTDTAGVKEEQSTFGLGLEHKF